MKMETQYIWYACYGSNLCKAKFIERYISECTDKTPPMEERPYILHHPLYFAGKSGRWNGGVAFVGTKQDEQVNTLGRVYKITMEQLNDIRRKEGPSDHWYGNKLLLGTLDGLPVYTLTRTMVHDFTTARLPAQAYTDVIREGLRETYPDVDADAYLEKALGHTQALIQGEKTVS
jgi:hypothetical protein